MGATPPEGQFDALRREIAELRASRERLALANDAERRSLERALHDGVQQLLVGLAATSRSRRDPSMPIPRRRSSSSRKRDATRRRRSKRPGSSRRGSTRPCWRREAWEWRCARRRRTRACRSGSTSHRTRPIPPRSRARSTSAASSSSRGSRPAHRWRSGSSDEAGTLTFEIEAEGDVDAERLPIRDRVEALGGRLTIEGSGDQTRAVGSLPLPRGG